MVICLILLYIKPWVFRQEKETLPSFLSLRRPRTSKIFLRGGKMNGFKGLRGVILCILGGYNEGKHPFASPRLDVYVSSLYVFIDIKHNVVFQLPYLSSFLMYDMFLLTNNTLLMFLLHTCYSFASNEPSVSKLFW